QNSNEQRVYVGWTSELASAGPPICNTPSLERRTIFKRQRMQNAKCKMVQADFGLSTFHFPLSSPEP
ncbi:MAG TPA: hypothetical protein VFI31_30480, partial [Pirellulales bacterium]|nr:hypothetical protein [Pirellulales bacterium]